MKYINATQIYHALIRSGGIAIGERPRTCLVKVYKVSDDGNWIKAEKVDAATGRPTTKRLNRYPTRDVVHHWVGMPSPQQIKEIRMAQPKYQPREM